MIEHVNKQSLIKGEKYYVKRRWIFLQSFKNFVCIFDYYNEFDEFAWVKMSDTLNIELDLQLNEFYRFISSEEYYAKVKEKYDDKCLNIVLKRLVDENFEW